MVHIDSVTVGATATALTVLSSKLQGRFITEINLQAAPANTAPIFIGNSDVAAAEGHELVAGGQLKISTDGADLQPQLLFGFAASNQRLNIVAVEG